MFIGDLRPAFLEFLRNLTPQILFLTTALVLGTQVDEKNIQLNLHGVKNAAPYFFCLAMFCAAWVANVTYFFDKCYSFIQESGATKNNKGSQLTALQKIQNFWRTNKATFMLAILLLIIFTFGLVAVALMAKHSAVAVLKGTL